VDVVNGEKVNFYETIKELEVKLGDSNIVLNSFIVSTTSFNALSDVQRRILEKCLGYNFMHFIIFFDYE